MARAAAPVVLQAAALTLPVVGTTSVSSVEEDHASAYTLPEISHISRDRSDLRGAIGTDLVTKANLRKAILLKEILGTPLGMKP